MMKKLLLIRHAKAVHTDGKDFERLLSERGIGDTEFMANQLKELQLIPDYILASAASRTKATADIIAQKLSVPLRADDKHIYEANTFTLLNIVGNLPDEHHFVALVGHNPGVSQLLYELTGQMRDMPTCSMALIDFDFDEWDMVSSDTGKLNWYGWPKSKES